MVRVGVIGVGSMGQQHARVYFHQDEVELVAVADAHKEQAEKIARRYNCVAYDDYHDLLERKDIAAVSIAVPTTLHHQVALEGLRLKKHVLLEKPIASTEQEAREIITCARENNALLMIGHIERFNPAISELKKRLERGDLGEVYKIDVQRIGPFPARITDVGVVVDLSVHDLDIVHYLLGVEPVRVYAEKLQRLHPAHEDLVTALVKYSSGVLAVLNVNYLSPTKVRLLKVFGKKGMFQVDYLTQELFFYENMAFGLADWESVSEGDMRKIIIPKKEPLLVEIQTFLECVRGRNSVPVTGEDGLRVLSLANVLLHSANENKIIELK